MKYSYASLKSTAVYLVICLIPILLISVPLLRVGKEGYALVFGALPLFMIMLLIFKEVRVRDGEIIFKRKKLIISDGEFYFKTRKIILSDGSITFKAPSFRKHIKLPMTRKIIGNIPILLPFALYCLMNFYLFLAHTYSSSFTIWRRDIAIIRRVFIPLIVVVLILNLFLITKRYLKKRNFFITNTLYMIALFSLCVIAIILLLTYQPIFWFLFVDSFIFSCWGPPPRTTPSITDTRVIILILLFLVAILGVWREWGESKWL
jgi:hypothetical protein